MERASNITVGMFVHVENEEALTNVVQPVVERAASVRESNALIRWSQRATKTTVAVEKSTSCGKIPAVFPLVLRDGRELTCGKCLRVWLTETSSRLGGGEKGV